MTILRAFGRAAEASPEPNDRLRRARLLTPSPSPPTDLAVQSSEFGHVGVRDRPGHAGEHDDRRYGRTSDDSIDSAHRAPPADSETVASITN
jgi:hypothetical protein